MTPVDLTNPKPARRARKTPADPAAPKAPAKPRAPRRAAPKKKAEPVAELAAAQVVAPQEIAPQGAAPVEEAPALVLSETLAAPAQILPVSPKEPASAEAHHEMRPAAPVWTSAPGPLRSPLAATVAFLVVLGALMLGYWVGYSVGSGTVEQTAVTVAEASEKPTAPVDSPLPAPPAAPEPAEPAPAAAPTTGLHLQVSALKNLAAAHSLQTSLEKRGFPVRVDPPSDDALVRVYVGPITDHDALETLTAELRKEGLKPFPKRL